MSNKSRNHLNHLSCIVLFLTHDAHSHEALLNRIALATIDTGIIILEPSGSRDINTQDVFEQLSEQGNPFMGPLVLEMILPNKEYAEIVLFPEKAFSGAPSLGFVAKPHHKPCCFYKLRKSLHPP